MPRKKKIDVGPAVVTMDKGTARGEEEERFEEEFFAGADFSVQEILNVRALVRVYEDMEVWTNGTWMDRPMPTLSPGTIVRIDPPADATDEQVAAVRDFFTCSGAAAIRVSPRRKSEVVVAGTCGEAMPAPKSARAAVEALVESANVADRDALRTFCDDVLSKVGL